MPDAPDFQSRLPMQSLAILFADLGGSTRLYDTLGDLRARRMTGEYIEQIIGEVLAQRGSVVKTIVVCDATKVRTTTGWKPRIPLEKTLKDILDDWRRKVEIKS